MTEERDVLVYITRWCGSCAMATQFLTEHSIAYRTVDIDTDADAAQTVMGLNQGNRSVPTIMIDGEHALTEPNRSQLREVFTPGE